MTRWRRATAVLALGPVVLTAVRVAGWWPCDIACQGGALYQRIAGIEVLWPALGAYSGLALLIAYEAWRHPRWSTVVVGATGLLAGASLFYLWVAWSLALLCPFCLTVHAAVLILLLAVAPDAAGTALATILIGGLGLNAVFHHRVQPDVAESTEAVSAPLSDLAQRADANRQRGVASAPFVIEYGYSLQCPHCAAAHGPLLATLAPAIAAGRVRLVLRPLVRAADPGTRLLAAWAFAAAARGPAVLDRFILAHLATKENLTRSELLTLGDELPALAAEADGGAFDRLIDQDQATLKRLAYRGSSPFVAVMRDGQVVARYTADIPLAALSAVIGP